MIISGRVERGRALGREIGYPTANVEVGSETSIEMGVYRSKVEFSGRSYHAITHVGTNPTVGGNPLRSESFIFDFEGDIYGEIIRIELLEFIRGEEHFPTIEALLEQINRDVEQVRGVIR